MSRVRAFAPGGNGLAPKRITISAVTQSVNLGNRNGPTQVRICNMGTAAVYIKAGGSDVTAALTDLTIPPNGFTEVQTFSPGANGDLYIAAIAAGATGVIEFAIGEGV